MGSLDHFKGRRVGHRESAVGDGEALRKSRDVWDVARQISADALVVCARSATAILTPAHSTPAAGMFCQPFICGTPPWIFMAADWAWTAWSIGETVSGVTDGVTTLPSDSATDAGIPPSGQRPGL